METWSLLLHEWTRWLWNVLLRSLLPPMWCLQNCWKDWRIWCSLWIVDLLPSLYWCNALEKEDQEEVQHQWIWPRGCRHLLPLHTLCHVPEFQRDQRKGEILTATKTNLSYYKTSKINRLIIHQNLDKLSAEILKCTDIKIQKCFFQFQFQLLKFL